MKKSLLVIVAIILITSLLGVITSCSGSAAPAKLVTLRLAIPSPGGDPIVTNAENFVKDFNDKAKGKYEIVIHPGESILSFPESLDGVRTGAVEMSLWPIGAFSGVDANFAAAEMPFLVNSIQADAALQTEMLPLYDSIMTKKFNCKPIYSFTCLGVDIISNKQIKTSADMKNMLIQSISPQTANFIELMGGAAVAIPFPDAYQSMEKGVIEATMQSASMMIQFKMQEVGKYVLKGYLTPAACAVAINLDVYNKMPKDIQKLLMDCGKTAMKSTNDFFIDVYNKNYAQMASVGLTVYSLPAAERDKWAQALQPYCDELYSKMDKDFADKLKNIGTELDKKYPYKE